MCIYNGNAQIVYWDTIAINSLIVEMRIFACFISLSVLYVLLFCCSSLIFCITIYVVFYQDDAALAQSILSAIKIALVYTKALKPSER